MFDCRQLGMPSKLKLRSECNFCLLFWGRGGEEQEALTLLSKKGGKEGSIESQQKFDFFSYDGTPNLYSNSYINPIPVGLL